MWKSRGRSSRPNHQVTCDQYTQRRSESKPENCHYNGHRPEPAVEKPLTQVEDNECSCNTPKRSKYPCEPRKLQRRMACRAADFIRVREGCGPRDPHKAYTKHKG